MREMQKLRGYLIAGFIVIIPLAATVYILVALFKLVDSILGGLLYTPIKNAFGFYPPGLGLLLFLLFIALIGMVSTRFLGNRLFPRLEKWFSGLPIIKVIYPALKQMIRYLVRQKELGFKKVVLVQYPSSGIWSMGFLTNDHFLKFENSTGKELVSVFMPTSPGPISGNVIFLPKEEVRLADITVADALKIIISGGVYKPVASSAK